jgi:integrase/recombinase XerD
LLEAGVDVHTIQVLMGHTDIRSTTIYLHVSKRNLAKVVSPLDNNSPKTE